MTKLYDHIDLRVPRLADAQHFFGTLLPALGFTRHVDVEGWFQFEATDQAVPAFFGITESPSHIPNENRIAFGASSRQAVNDLAEVVKNAGARNIEGPIDYAPGYYAVFFEDPCGNRFEICHRASSTASA